MWGQDPPSGHAAQPKTTILRTRAGLAIGKLQKLFAYSADLLSSTNNKSVDLSVCDIILRYCNVTLLQTLWPHCTT